MARALWAAPFLVVGPLAALAPRSLLTVLLGGCVLGLLTHAVRRSRLRRPPWRVALFLGAFVAYAGLSASWSLVPGSAIGQLVKLVYMFTAALLCAAMLAEAPAKARRAAAAGLAIGVLAGVGLVLFDTAAGHPLLGAVHGTGPAGQVGDPAANRSVVALGTFVWPAALALTQFAGAIWPLVLPVGFLLLSGFTTSQSATFGLAAGLAVLLAATLSLRTARYFVLAVLLVGFAGAVPLARLAYSAGLSEASWLQYSARHRIEVWNFAAERIARRPIFGYGLDSSRAMPNEGDVSKFESWTDKVIPLHTHNMFLQLWLELGAIGAALAFAAGAALLRALRSWTDNAQRFALAAFTCNLAMAAVTSFSMWQTWWTSALILSALSLLPGAGPSVTATADEKGAP